MSFAEFLKRFLAVLFILLLWAGAWAARSTLLLGFAAAVIAVGISIPVNRLETWGWRRGWAILLSAAGVGLIAILLLLLVFPRLVVEIVSLLSSIPDAIRSLADVYATVRQRNELLAAALPPFPVSSAEVAEIAPERARAILEQLLNASLAIAPSLLGGVSQVVAVIVNLVFVLFIAIFFLVDPQIYVKGSLFLLPRREHPQVIAIWNKLYATIKVWLTSLFLSISITVTLVWVILGLLLGMPNAVVVAVFAGLATFVPNVGAFLPLIPIAIFTLADEPAQLLYMAPAYLAIQLLESNVITPSIVKAELNIPPGVLMLFQLLITIAFGALGLLLAVPVFATLMVLVREIYSYRLLGLHHFFVDVTTAPNGEFALVESARGAVAQASRDEIAPVTEAAPVTAPPDPATSTPATSNPTTPPRQATNNTSRSSAKRRKRRAKNGRG